MRKMMLRKVAGMVAGTFLSVTAVAAQAPATDACTLAYKAKVQPILNTNCVACHQDAAPAGELSLQRSSAPASLFAQSSESKLKRVAPGDLQNSYLYRKLMGTHLTVGNGERMPLGGKLVSSDIAVISTWITGCKGK